MIADLCPTVQVSPALFNDCDNDNNALIATDRDQALGTPACSSSHNSGSGHGHDAPQPYSESVYRRDLEGARVATSIATRPLGTPVFYILFLLSNYSLTGRCYRCNTTVPPSHPFKRDLHHKPQHISALVTSHSPSDWRSRLLWVKPSPCPPSHWRTSSPPWLHRYSSTAKRSL